MTFVPMRFYYSIYVHHLGVNLRTPSVLSVCNITFKLLLLFITGNIQNCLFRSPSAFGSQHSFLDRSSSGKLWQPDRFPLAGKKSLLLHSCKASGTHEVRCISERGQLEALGYLVTKPYRAFTKEMEAIFGVGSKPKLY